MENAILPQFWTLDTRFAREGCVSLRLVAAAPILREKDEICEQVKKERERETEM